MAYEMEGEERSGAERLLPDEAVDQRRKNIHQQNGEGDPFGVRAETADDRGNQTAAERENDFSGRCGRRRRVISGHEDRAEQQTAGQERIERVGAEEPAEQNLSLIHI